MNVRIQPSTLTGTVSAIASKSDVHRLLFCAAQADGPVTIQLQNTPLLSDDLLATVEVLRQMGAFVVQSEEQISVTPAGIPADTPVFDCRESGSTLRFLLPVAAVLGADAAFTGHGKLPQRPLSP
ncbi:MAG: 3-phosphoshikimate 1-carboxyvinyltransferase, partial [Clostridia bacterium]|nr:3-phosphoshikimate 1-carboxyvinyltransferase [Clostridia bacterium]